MGGKIFGVRPIYGSDHPQIALKICRYRTDSISSSFENVCTKTTINFRPEICLFEIKSVKLRSVTELREVRSGRWLSDASSTTGAAWRNRPLNINSKHPCVALLHAAGCSVPECPSSVLRAGVKYIQHTHIACMHAGHCRSLEL